MEDILDEALWEERHDSASAVSKVAELVTALHSIALLLRPNNAPDLNRRISQSTDPRKTIYCLTNIAPMATKATGEFVCPCVMCKTARLLSVKTSNPGSLTACGFTTANIVSGRTQGQLRTMYQCNIVRECPLRRLVRHR